MTTAARSGTKTKSASLSVSRPPPRLEDYDDFFDAEIEKGLAAGTSEALVAIPVAGKKHFAIALSAIVERSRLQTRRRFDPEGDGEDAALVESLRARGQDTPIILEQMAGRMPAQYRIKDGHRRVDALRHLGHLRVEAVVVQEGTAESDLITLTANVRKNLGPMEWARAIQHLLAAGMSAAEIARKIGVSPTRVSQWTQLLNLSEVIQEEVDRQHLSLAVALALGQAPLRFQSALARLAAQNDFTEKKALLLAGHIREEFLGEGETSVDVGQAAVNLGLLPPAASTESRLAGPASEDPGAAEILAPEPDSAACAPLSGVAATAGQETKSLPSALPPQRRKHGRGRVPERTMSFEGAMNVLKAYFPSLVLHDARSLAELAVRQGLNEKVLLLAGLYRLEGEQEPAEAVKSALSMSLTPEVRAQLGTLEAIVRQYDLIDRGRFDEKSERLLQLQLLVARQPERVRQAVTQQVRVNRGAQSAPWRLSPAGPAVGNSDAACDRDDGRPPFPD